MNKTKGYKREFKMTIQEQANLDQFVHAFVDEQSGLVDDKGDVNAGALIWPDTITLWSHGSMSEDEWVDEGEELMEQLYKHINMVWQIDAVSRYSLTLRRVE